MNVRVGSWGHDLGSRGLSGSIYAVPEPVRVAAALALVDEGIGVHADLIIRADGSHRGVDPAQLLDVRCAVSEAPIDVHLITDPGASEASTSRAVSEAIEVAGEIGATRLIVSRSVLNAHSGVLQALRRHGVPVWSEVPVGTVPTPSDGADDGCLIMFIPPGTVAAADHSALDSVRALARVGRPVGVDGGITAELAEQCVNLGADPIVSGRALLTTSF